jgi:GR25 family glycosyltransferase involved in LPS biosynthesis
MITSISDIKHAFYINLDYRTDRREHIEKELSKIGINATRFNAVKLNNGAIGCSMSHLKCLEFARDNNYDHILIVEDDTTFLDALVFQTQFNNFLKNSQNRWDVVLLAGNNVPPYKRIDNTCIKVTSCQTTTAYLVNGHYLNTLIQNIREGMNKLLRQPENKFHYAIDKYWFSLQRKDNWYLITPLTVVQREDYSDIENKNTNYKHLMIDLDKEFLFRQNHYPSY